MRFVRPLIIILMTASLSSNTTSSARTEGPGRVVGTKSIFAQKSYIPSRVGMRAIDDRSLPVMAVITPSHRSRVGITCMQTPMSKAMTSASVMECDTAPCFLQFHDAGARMFGPTRSMKDPPVDLLSSKSPAEPASTYLTMAQLWTTKQN
jgi:hypothetical protein